MLSAATSSTCRAPSKAQEEILYWLALRLVAGLGPVTTRKQLTKLKSPQAISRGSASELEGAQYSGSAITAKLAMDQAREVFAAPGNITSKMSWSPNLLIKEGGARLVQEWSDITNELPAAVRRELVHDAQLKISLEGTPESRGSAGGASPEPLKALGRKRLNTLKVYVPQQLDAVLESFHGVSSSELVGALFDLDMSGQIRQLPGKNFVKV